MASPLKSSETRDTPALVSLLNTALPLTVKMLWAPLTRKGNRNSSEPEMLIFIPVLVLKVRNSAVPVLPVLPSTSAHDPACQVITIELASGRSPVKLYSQVLTAPALATPAPLSTKLGMLSRLPLALRVLTVNSAAVSVMVVASMSAPKVSGKVTTSFLLAVVALIVAVFTRLLITSSGTKLVLVHETVEPTLATLFRSLTAPSVNVSLTAPSVNVPVKLYRQVSSSIFWTVVSVTEPAPSPEMVNSGSVSEMESGLILLPSAPA